MAGWQPKEWTSDVAAPADLVGAALVVLDEGQRALDTRQWRPTRKERCLARDLLNEADRQGETTAAGLQRALASVGRRLYEDHRALILVLQPVVDVLAMARADVAPPYVDDVQKNVVHLLKTVALRADPMPSPSAGLLPGHSGWVLARHFVACALVLGLTLSLPYRSYGVGTRALTIAGLGVTFVTLAVLAVRDLRRLPKRDLFDE